MVILGVRFFAGGAGVHLRLRNRYPTERYQGLQWYLLHEASWVAWEGISELKHFIHCSTSSRNSNRILDLTSLTPRVSRKGGDLSPKVCP